jgi:phosphate transport system permease protein
MILSSNNISSHSKTDLHFLWGLRVLALLAGSLLVLVIGFVFRESWPALTQIGLSKMFTDSGWFPTEDSYRLTPMISGTILAAGGSILLAAPLGILSAVFCHFYAPPILGLWYRRMVELLAGIPSVVFGFWGLVVLVPLIAAWHPPGPSLLAGILILTLMIIPTIMLIAHSSISQVPTTYIHSATALGLSHWALIWHVVLPVSRIGLLTGIFLGLARALGETMAILMVCGNVVQHPSHIFDPVRTLTANIALEMAYALDHHRAVLFISGLLLMGLVMCFVGVAEALRQKTADAVAK